eukprot:8681178-Alexandrium_andersonii.AAC.1
MVGIGISEPLQSAPTFTMPCVARAAMAHKVFWKLFLSSTAPAMLLKHGTANLKMGVSANFTSLAA